MSGHRFSQLQNENFDTSNLPKCPKYYDSGCNNGVTPLRKLYMMHPQSNMKLGIIAWNNFQRILKEDREYGWYSISGKNYICVLFVLCSIKCLLFIEY